MSAEFDSKDQPGATQMPAPSVAPRLPVGATPGQTSEVSPPPERIDLKLVPPRLQAQPLSTTNENSTAAIPSSPTQAKRNANLFQPPPIPIPATRVKDSFTNETVRRRRLTEYERALRREANELEDDSRYETENTDLIFRHARGRMKKAALPRAQKSIRNIIFRGSWRKRYTVHARTAARLKKYKLSIAGLIRSAFKAFSTKRGGNKQS